MTALAALLALTVLLWPGRGPVWPRHQLTRADTPPSRPDTDRAEVAELFAAGLDAGLTVAEATRWCAGTPIDDPHVWWDARVPAVARALAVSDRLGSPTAATVRAAADAEREASALDDEIASGLAGVRATAWLLTALPLVGAGVGLAIGGVTAPALVSIGAGLALTALGWTWLRQLVRRTRVRALR